MLPVFVIARWEGRRALVPRLARRPSRRFLVVPPCAARRVAVFPSAHLVFEFLFRRVFFCWRAFYAICGCFVLVCDILLWLTAVYVR